MSDDRPLLPGSGATATLCAMPDQEGSGGELVRAARDGSREAWAAIVDRFSPLVMAVARRYRLSPPDVDDVYQVVWLRLAEHLDRLRDPDRVAGWLATTTRNEALRVARRAQREAHADLEIIAADDTPTDDLLSSNEIRVAVAAAFATLGERCRQLLSYLLVKELHYEEVSRRLGMPVGSIGPTRQRCLQRLRSLLATQQSLELA